MKPSLSATFAALCCALLLVAPPSSGQVPQIINYQGRITVGTTNFNGNGQFKFALVDGSGTVLWSNAPIAAGQPNAHVVLPVANGIYSVFLGDTVMSNMAAIPAGVFGGSDVRLRIWFNNGVLGFQQLSPDQRIGAVGYAIMAGSVPDGAITSSKIAPGAVTPDKLAATESLTLTNLGELFVNAVSVAESPRTFTGTVTLDLSGTPHVATDVTFVETPALEIVNEDGTPLGSGGPPGVSKMNVSHLVVRRPLTNDTAWAGWFSSVAAATTTVANVTVAFTGGPTVLMQGSFPTSYTVERGADGVFYETMKIKPGTYEPQ